MIDTNDIFRKCNICKKFDDITSFPEKNKRYYYFHGDQLVFFDQVFYLNITNDTNEILFVFRKKSFIDNDPIVASAIIHSTEFPKIPQNINQLNLEKSETDIKVIDILEPKHQNMTNDSIRKKIGSINIKLSTVAPIPESNEKKNPGPTFPNKPVKIDLFNNNDEDQLIEEPKYNSYTEYMLF